MSLCMIVKNEEKWIGRCLESVRHVVDEMIIVDTGSTDRTVEIAESVGATVYSFPWTNHFADARNYGIERASGDWIVWLDADEEVDSVDAPRLRSVLEMDDQNLVFVELINYYGESPPDPDKIYRLAHHRLFRNGIGIRFNGSIHEQLNNREILGNQEQMKMLDVKVYHYGYLDSEVTAKAKSERNLTLLKKASSEPAPDPWIEYHLASEHYRLENFPEAFQHVNQSIRLFLENSILPPAMLYKLKYSSLIALGSLDNVVAAIDKALGIYPDYVDLHYLKGIALLHRNIVQEAAEAFRYCITLGDDNLRYLTMKGTGSFQAYYYLGECYEKLGKIVEARGAYLEALRLSPNYLEAQVRYNKLRANE
ncbi:MULTISPECIES: glycosyltransferase [unclassified Paenibacillus]|uniref:glycosyltransferase n=1 Tax=unclassified Paenibacillus TaxID=185978 RepID=UPI0036C26E94